MNKEKILELIDEEPEMPGDIPEEFWETIQNAVINNDRDVIEQAFVLTVKKTKDNIKEGIENEFEESEKDSSIEVNLDVEGYLQPQPSDDEWLSEFIEVADEFSFMSADVRENPELKNLGFGQGDDFLASFIKTIKEQKWKIQKLESKLNSRDD